jgi:hypothetical protein
VVLRYLLGGRSKSNNLVTFLVRRVARLVANFDKGGDPGGGTYTAFLIDVDKALTVFENRLCARLSVTDFAPDLLAGRQKTTR